MNWLSELFAHKSAKEEEEEVPYESRFQRDFEVKTILGKGAFGSVFEAVNRFDNVTYAIKRISISNDLLPPTTTETDAQAYASREPLALSKLDHPGIVRYYHAWIEEPPVGWQEMADEEMLGQIDSRWENHIAQYLDDWRFVYVQIQLCKYSLESWLKRNNEQLCRPLPQMKSWFKQIVSAVAYMHGKEIIHRDLKPANILFANGDTLKLCDLGLATEIVFGNDGEEIVRNRTYAGSPMYMSPEQARQDDFQPMYGLKTDVFSLGLIFAEMCVAMKASELETFCDNCRNGARNGIINDKSVAEFVEKLAQVDPDDRPTCAEIMQEKFLVDTPTC